MQVAIIDRRVAGFAGLDDNGHVVMLVVDPDPAPQGVAATMFAVTVALAPPDHVMARTTAGAVSSGKRGFLLEVR